MVIEDVADILNSSCIRRHGNTIALTQLLTFVGPRSTSRPLPETKSLVGFGFWIPPEVLKVGGLKGGLLDAGLACLWYSFEVEGAFKLLTSLKTALPPENSLGSAGSAR